MLKKIFVFLIMFIGIITVYAKEEYLKSILIDGKQIEGFSVSKTDYSLEVPADKEKINLVFDYDYNNNKDKYTVSGNQGELNLKVGLNEFKFTIKDKTTLEEIIIYVVRVTRLDNRSNDNSLSSLTVGGQKITLTDKNDYTINVNNMLNKIDIKFTLHHEKAQVVEGYGERTVDLSGEKTVVPIKIQAENGDVRTYNLNIIKTDYKSNDATLKSLKIDKANLDFKSNILEYNLDVPYDVEKIVVTPTVNNDKAIVTVNPSYALKVGLNSISILVTAEDGTVKEYKLNVTRLEKAYLVNKIEIEGIEINFDNKKTDYQIKTNLEKLKFNVILNNEKATLEEIGNENLKNGSIITIKVTLDEEVETYKFEISSEKEELDKEDNQNEEEMQDNSKKFNLQDFFMKNEMIISLVVLGIGILSFLSSIIVRARKVK